MQWRTHQNIAACVRQEALGGRHVAAVAPHKQVQDGLHHNLTATVVNLHVIAVQIQPVILVVEDLQHSDRSIVDTGTAPVPCPVPSEHSHVLGPHLRTLVDRNPAIVQAFVSIVYEAIVLFVVLQCIRAGSAAYSSYRIGCRV